MNSSIVSLQLHVDKINRIGFSLTSSSNCNIGFLIVVFQTEADKRFLAAKGSVPIGIGRNSHIKRAIIDKNARIGENVKVIASSIIYNFVRCFTF